MTFQFHNLTFCDKFDFFNQLFQLIFEAKKIYSYLPFISYYVNHGREAFLLLKLENW